MSSSTFHQPSGSWKNRPWGIRSVSGGPRPSTSPTGGIWGGRTGASGGGGFPATAERTAATTTTLAGTTATTTLGTVFCSGGESFGGEFPPPKIRKRRKPDCIAGNSFFRHRIGSLALPLPGPAGGDASTSSPLRRRDEEQGDRGFPVRSDDESTLLGLMNRRRSTDRERSTKASDGGNEGKNKNFRSPSLDISSPPKEQEDVEEELFDFDGPSTRKSRRAARRARCHKKSSPCGGVPDQHSRHASLARHLHREHDPDGLVEGSFVERLPCSRRSASLCARIPLRDLCLERAKHRLFMAVASPAHLGKVRRSVDEDQHSADDIDENGLRSEERTKASAALRRASWTPGYESEFPVRGARAIRGDDLAEIRKQLPSMPSGRLFQTSFYEFSQKLTNGGRSVVPLWNGDGGAGARSYHVV